MTYQARRGRMRDAMAFQRLISFYGGKEYITGLLLLRNPPTFSLQEETEPTKGPAADPTLCPLTNEKDVRQVGG
ncbi:hypothetical protein BHM03_00041574 [Ensete ventricosum]|nr:hypothetical protein BHM03_00041574 [Ensete ventricosum]